MKPARFEFENRLVWLTCFVLSLLLFAAFIFNLFIEISLVQNIIILSASVIFLVLFFIGKRVKQFHSIKIIMAVFMLFLLDFVWFTNYASNGPVLTAFLLYLCFIVFAFNWKYILIFTPLVFVNVGCFYYIEVHYPQIIITYASESDRLNDVYFGIVVSLVLILIFTVYAKRHYIREYINAKSSDELKSAFLDNMSHEIRTPLNAIAGFSEILTREENSKEEIRRYKDMIFRSSRHLIKFINEILDISLIESNQLQIEKESFSLKDYFTELMRDVEFLKKHHHKSEVSVEQADNLEDIQIHTDKQRLNEVFLVLMDNAFKYTKLGSVRYGYNISSNECVFYIADTGTGIHPENMERIFERFVKIEDGKNKLYRGIGQGLYLSKRIVELLGGRIWVRSKKDIGSTFYFSLPVTESNTVKTTMFSSKILS